MYRNSYGTYMHGSHLQKNPHFADFLIALALKRSYERSDRAAEDLVQSIDQNNGSTPPARRTKASKWPSKIRSKSRQSIEDDPVTFLTPLEDTLEWEAHAALLERMGLYSAAADALRRYIEVGTVLHLPETSPARE